MLSFFWPRCFSFPVVSLRTLQDTEYKTVQHETRLLVQAVYRARLAWWDPCRRSWMRWRIWSSVNPEGPISHLCSLSYTDFLEQPDCKSSVVSQIKQSAKLNVKIFENAIIAAFLVQNMYATGNSTSKQHVITLMFLLHCMPFWMCFVDSTLNVSQCMYIFAYIQKCILILDYMARNTK